MDKLFKHMYKQSDASLYTMLEERLKTNKKTFIVTANAEIFMNVDKSSLLYQTLLDKDTIITPDGEGVVYAAKKLGHALWGKIAGIDTVKKLLEMGDRNHSKIYFFGAKQEVIDNLYKKITKEYPGIEIVGMKNGYDYDRSVVFQEIAKKAPDIVFVALGVPAQEKEIAEHLNQFSKGIFIGCGGSLDVLSGQKCRAPKIFIKLKLEWAYRILKEPSRFKRFYHNNIKFMFKIKKLARQSS